ncbi:hypothetical protein BT93_E0323 [Corymbia citriodora subsp. variegata]|nr:hypothetical protein BT93_E0323 [Corymbia citriodora subsp. variegata]
MGGGSGSRAGHVAGPRVIREWGGHSGHREPKKKKKLETELSGNCRKKSKSNLRASENVEKAIIMLAEEDKRRGKLSVVRCPHARASDFVPRLELGVVMLERFSGGKKTGRIEAGHGPVSLVGGS